MIERSYRVNEVRTEAGQLDAECVFVPANEPWSCMTHHGGLRTRLDEPQCDVAKPAEPFNDAYLNNVRASLAEGKKLPGHYITRRLLATLDRDRAEARASAFAQVEEAVKGLRMNASPTDFAVGHRAALDAVLAAIADLRTEGGTDAEVE